MATKTNKESMNTVEKIVLTSYEDIEKVNLSMVDLTQLPKLSGKITNVMQPESNRLSIFLDKPFVSIDKETRKIKLVTSFGINIFNLMNMLGDQVPALNMAKAMALGKAVNPKIVALCLNGATLESANRVFHASGELRYDGTPYAGDSISTEDIHVTPHINPQFEGLIMQLVMTQPTAESAITVAQASVKVW